MTKPADASRAFAVTGWIALVLGLLALGLYGVSVETGWRPWALQQIGQQTEPQAAGDGAYDEALNEAWRLLGGHLGGVRFDELTGDAARLEQAGERIDRVLAADPDNARALMLRGLQRSAEGRGEDAVVSVRRSVEVGGGLQSMLVLGALHADLGRTAESVEVLQEAVRVYPDSLAAWNNLGQALWLDGRQAEAEAAYRRKLEIEDAALTVESVADGNP